MTDANGEVEFLTKFPGWYPGRTVHIHFQVFLNSMLQVTSQFCYPTAGKNALLTSEAPYTTWGADPVYPSERRRVQRTVINTSWPRLRTTTAQVSMSRSSK